MQLTPAIGDGAATSPIFRPLLLFVDVAQRCVQALGVVVKNTFCSGRIALKRSAYPEAKPSRLQLGLAAAHISDCGFVKSSGKSSEKYTSPSR